MPQGGASARGAGCRPCRPGARRASHQVTWGGAAEPPRSTGHPADAAERGSALSVRLPVRSPDAARVSELRDRRVQNSAAAPCPETRSRYPPRARLSLRDSAFLLVGLTRMLVGTKQLRFRTGQRGTAHGGRVCVACAVGHTGLCYCVLSLPRRGLRAGQAQVSGYDCACSQLLRCPGSRGAQGSPGHSGSARNAALPHPPSHRDRAR